MARRSGQCPPRRSASGAVPPRAFGAASTKSVGHEAPSGALRDFRYRSQSTPCPGRWVRFLAGMALVQAMFGLLLWLRTPGQAGASIEFKALPANLTAFADPDENINIVDVSKLQDIAVLIIATGRNLAVLRECLHSLNRVSGLDATSVLVSQDAVDDASRKSVEREFGFSWIAPASSAVGQNQPPSETPTVDLGSRSTAAPSAQSWQAHYKRSLEHAVWHHFYKRRYRAIVVVEEDMVFAPDMLWYFAQLELVLQRDRSLWCVSAWNDNGLAPYVADPTVVMRTDWFSGVGWLAHLEVLRGEILSQWPSSIANWRDWLRSLMSQHAKQCLFPEVSRLAFSTMTCKGAGQCGAEEVFERSLSMRSVMSSSQKVNLGDVTRLERAKYWELVSVSWPREQTIAHANLVTSIEELESALEHLSLEAREREMVLDQSTARRPLLLRFPVFEGSAWEGIAAYFGLAPWAPRCVYYGVVRLRWRDFVLFLAANLSPLLVNRASDFAAEQGVTAIDLFQRSRNPSQLQPAAVPPRSVLNQAPQGVSCSRYCESMRHICVDADLLAVDRCSHPLTSVFTCRSCQARSSAKAAPGWDWHDDTCATSGTEDESLQVPDCSSADLGMRRLCLCRRQRGQLPIQLQSPGRRALRPRADGLAQVSAQRQRAFKAATQASRLEVANINRFASYEADSSGGAAKPKTDIQPSGLAVLVVALPTRRSEPRDLELLRQTLASLQAANGFDAERVLVAHDDGLLSTAQLIQEKFYLLRVEVLASKDFKDPAARAAKLYRGALEYAINSHFGRSRSILVLEEGTVVAPDILWYMAQLEPLLMQDSSILCVSALNDNGIAPYVADATVVMRTDFFSGVAWLARTSVLRKEFLPLWPSDHWERSFREARNRHGRHCLIPELSRAKPLSSPTPSRQGGKLSNTYKDFWESMPLCKRPWVDLGDTQRLINDRYRNLFLNTWMGEGLVNAKQLKSIRPLKDGRLNDGGPWRLVYHSDNPDHDMSWQPIAGFFMIWPEVPIRGAYYGVVRLRWHNTVIFLVPSSSALARSAPDKDGAPVMLRGAFVADPKLFLAMSRPLLLPANSEIVGASSIGVSCHYTCQEHGLTCSTEDLYFINNCAALTGVFQCLSCEPSEGSEQPAQVVKPESNMHQKCLYNTDTRSLSPSCGAKHADTLRLCVCRASTGHAPMHTGSSQRTQASPSDAITAPAAQSWYKAAPDVVASTTTTTRTTTTRTTTSEAPVPPPPFATRLKTQPSQLNILVIATGRRPKYLRKCLDSLRVLPGYHRDRILVSQDGQGDESRRVAEKEFRVGWTRNKQGDTNTFQAFGQRVTAHFKYALTYALTQHFPAVRSLVVIEEDVIAAPDFLWYFAQLEPLLHEDTSLWCISAWNDNALAPYVADPAALLRTDIFSGVAWMLPADLYRGELLRRWPTNSWDKYLRSKTARAGRQCVIPEMPRARHIGTIGEDVAVSVQQTIERDESMFWDPSPKLRAVDLGDISRLTKVAYNRMFSAELRGARMIEHVFQLPDPAVDADSSASKGQGLAFQDVESEDHTGLNSSLEAPSWRLHYQTDSPETDDSWKYLARFFRLKETSAPRGTYREVLRIRWGPGVLFVVAQTSPMIWEAHIVELPLKPMPPYEFASAKQPVLVPPGGVVLAARSQGLSCSTVCSAEGRECVTADLVFINSCDALTRFHFCEKCESNIGSDQPALVSEAGNQFYGRCLYNNDMHQYPPSCQSAHRDTRRLCICRPPVYLVAPIKVAFHVPTPLEDTESLPIDNWQSDEVPMDTSEEENSRWPSSGAVDNAFQGSTQAIDATLEPSAQAQRASLTAPARSSNLGTGNATAALSSLKSSPLAVNLEDYGWQGGHHGEAWTPRGIAAFAELGSPVDPKIKPEVLPVVVLASSYKPNNLRACLTSLRQAKGFSPENVLVVQDLPGAGDFSEVHRVAKEFGVSWANHNSFNLGPAARANAHYKFAIERSLNKHFKGARSLIVLSENEVVSPDILVFFAQLEPLLHQDRTLWCVSAWNDNGFAPYVADLTALQRTDWFPGVAWLLRADLFQLGGEVLRGWPQEGHWKEYLRLDTVRRGRECIIPEVSRAKLSAPNSTLREEHSAFDEQALPIFWSDARQEVDLGDVQRMLALSFERLLLTTWPGLEGLALSNEVASLEELDRAQRGNLRLVIRNDMETWAAVAKFFRLGPAQPVGAYQGILRLRWRGGILYIVLQGSPLVQRAGLSAAQRIFSAFDFQSSQRPVLRAPDAAVILSKPGQSCDDACNATDIPYGAVDRQRCHVADLLFLNSCAALRHYGGDQSCSNCVTSSGQDQPSILATRASTTAAAAPDVGTCFWNANLAEPPSCEAAHPRTARLCACRPGRLPQPTSLPGSLEGLRWANTAGTAGDNRMKKMAKSTLRGLEPRNRIDASLNSHRCGAMFGNRLSADCATEDLWCCSAGMWCGNSPSHCSNAASRASISEGSDCLRGNPTKFCGLGWSLRLPELGLSSIA